MEEGFYHTPPRHAAFACHILQITKKSPAFYLFEAVFMKRTPVFSGKGFAFHIL